MNKLISKIARKIDPPEPPRTTGQWVRGLNGAIIWDPWDMDAPPENDPLPRILEQLKLTRERLQAQPGWTEPTEEQKADGRRALDDAMERIRAEKQAVRDFTAQVERERAERAA